MTHTCMIYDNIMTLHTAEKDSVNGTFQVKHAECPERITCIYKALKDIGIKEIPSRKATWKEVECAHSKEYCEQLINDLKGTDCTGDMFHNKFTLPAALMAAGSTCELVNTILNTNSKITSGFAIVRPPGHHACHDKWSGFCYLNNVMIASLSALTRNPALKILVVDWDIHYHSGSADIIKNSSFTAEQLVVFSMHRGDFFPGDDMSLTDSYYNGQVVNKEFYMTKRRKDIPGDMEYTHALAEFLVNYKKNYGSPDIIIVSCGFDAVKGDPIGGFRVSSNGYYSMTKQLREVCPNVALVLEGGYNCKIIPKCAVACMNALKSY